MRLTGSRGYAARVPAVSAAIPLGLAGDWESQGHRFRFNNDGAYSLVASLSYTVEGDTLRLSSETYERRAGADGLQGVWRTTFGEGEWLDITFGPYGFYSYVWFDDLSGGGYYEATVDEVTVVEQRARVSCEGDSITFTNADGEQSGTFTLAGDTLTVDMSGETTEYTGIPFWD
jgi:hypothetical protein